MACILVDNSLDVKKYLLSMNISDYLVYPVILFNVINVHTRYTVNDLTDGNVLDLSMSAEACFDDGGPCVVNISILNNVLVPKAQKTWDKLFSIKGKFDAICNTEFSYL